MSQEAGPSSTPATTFRPQMVLDAISGLNRRMVEVNTNVKQCTEMIQCAAKLLAQTGSTEEELEPVFDDLKATIDLDAKIQGHQRALDQLHTTYAPSVTQPTNFQELLEPQNIAQVDITQTSAYSTVMDILRARAQASQPPANDAEDDDIVVQEEASTLPNAMCPLTGKSVFELQRPKQDQYGYIYECEAIENHIRSIIEGGGDLDEYDEHGQRICDGRVWCPVAGTRHRIGWGELRDPGVEYAKAKMLADLKNLEEEYDRLKGIAQQVAHGDVIVI